MAQIIVGLDLGTHSVRAARLRLGFKSAELERLAVDRTDQQSWPDVEAALKGADVVLSSLPGDQIVMRKLSVFASAEKRLAQIIPGQFDDDVPLDVQDMVLDHMVLDKTKENITVQVVGALQENVRAHLETLAAHKANPKEVGAGGFVYTDLGKPGAPTGTTLLVDGGHERSDVVVLAEGQVASVRTVSFGGRNVTEALADAYEVDVETAAEWKRSQQYLVDWDLSQIPEQQRKAAEAVRKPVGALLREMRQTMAAHTMGGGQEADRILLCGGGAKLPGLKDYIQKSLDREVQFLESPEAITNAGEKDIEHGAKALALALRGRSLRSRRINLRQGPLAFEGEARSGLGLFFYAAAIVVLIMFAWGFSAYGRSVSLEQQQEAQIERLASDSERLLGQKVTTFTKLGSLIEQAGGERDTVSPVPSKDAFDVVEEISKRIPATINHEIDSLDIRAGRTQIQGRVDQRRDADAIVTALGEWQDCFSKVQVTRTTPAVRDDRLQYTMDIETRCP